jgi:hypothetical protein
MGLTRRDLMTGALGGALGAAGMYELVDRLAVAQPAPRRAPLVRGAQEQHIVAAPVSGERGLRIVVPPRHHAVATARVDTGSPRDAQRDFEKLKAPDRSRLSSVTVAVNGRTKVRARGAEVRTPITLRGLRKRSTIKVTARTSTRRTYTAARTYQACR